MKIVVVILPRFQEAGMRIAKFLEAESLPYSESVFTELYGKCDVIICIMSAGIAVRGCAPLLTDKWHDPAIVVVTPDMRYAIPILGGHHGGNEVAKRLADLGIEPVISTATEVMGRPSVEETARSGWFTIVNRSSTREVNGAISSGLYLPKFSAMTASASSKVAGTCFPFFFTSGVFNRSGELMNSKPNTPFGQSFPSLTGER